MPNSLLSNFLPSKDDKITCHFQDPLAVKMLSERFSLLLRQLNPNLVRQVVILGIGTDRSTGDCLGPLVGTKLNEFRPKGFSVYGTLDEPVHASNMVMKIAGIKEKHPNAFVVAVDASLGRAANVGKITLAPGALKPGTGVNKELPHVGEMHYAGIINVGGHMEYFVLQNTRLSLVIKVAEKISFSIFRGFEHALKNSDHLHDVSPGQSL